MKLTWILMHSVIVLIASRGFAQASGCEVPDGMTQAQKIPCIRAASIMLDQPALTAIPSVITSKAANGYHFKTGQRDWPSRTENVLPCRLLWWQVGFGSPAPGAAFENVAVMQ
jgi:hypothetical protein